MIDYSKWENLKVSDDEDEEKPTDLDERMNVRLINKNRILEIEKQLANKKGDQNALQIKLECIKKESEESKSINSIENCDKKRKSINKTTLNTQLKEDAIDEKTLKERGQEFKQFVECNEKLCREYGLLHTLQESKTFLEANLQLVCDHTSNYLGLWSLNLELAGKNGLVSQVAHQHMIMQYILKLAVTLNVDARSSIDSFFATIQKCSPEYREQFELEIQTFKELIKNRAMEKRKEVLDEYERQDRSQRLGPGGLDPLEVLHSLPPELKDCFDKSDVKLLMDTIAAMPEETGDYYMKRCIDAGLWSPFCDEDKVTTTTSTSK